MDPLLVALRARQARQGELQRVIAASTDRQAPRIDRRAVERQVRERLTRWRALLTRNVEDGRELFRQVLGGPIRFTPNPDEQQYQFSGEVELGRLFTGIASLAPFVASPSGTAPSWPRDFSRIAA